MKSQEILTATAAGNREDGHGDVRRADPGGCAGALPSGVVARGLRDSGGDIGGGVAGGGFRVRSRAAGPSNDRGQSGPR